MSMLRRLRRASLGLLKSCGVSHAIARSQWRHRRLLILCFHGISIEDEHAWLPNLYMPQSALAARFAQIRNSGCVVLPLSEALERLYAGTLPSRSVAITFDDGGYDFYLRAYPVVRASGFPVTVYQTTYYVQLEKPIFSLACSYMLWRKTGAVLPPVGSLGLSQARNLSLEVDRQAALDELTLFAEKNGRSGKSKDELAQQLAEVLDFDYREF